MHHVVRVPAFSFSLWLFVFRLQMSADDKKYRAANRADRGEGKAGDHQKVVQRQGPSGGRGNEKRWSVEEAVNQLARTPNRSHVSTYLFRPDRKFSDFRLVFDFKLPESETHFDF